MKMNWRKNQLFQLTLIQFKEFFREPGALFWSFVFPILMAWGLGFAFQKKQDVIRNIAITLAPGQKDSLLTSFLQRSSMKPDERKAKYQYTASIKSEKLGKTTFHFYCVTYDTALVLLKRGNISVILSEENKKINYLFDPVNPEAQLIYIYLSSLINQTHLMLDEAEIKPLTKIGTRYIDFLIPGLIALGIMNSCLWGISYSLIEKRSKKLLKRMVATPMRKSNFLISNVLSRMILTFCETFILVLFAYINFHIRIQGSIPALILILICGNITFIGVGILISSRTANTQIGNGLINAINMPMMVLSGVFFSYYNFPDWTLPIVQKLPLTIFADSIRAVFIEGASLTKMLLPSVWLSAIGIICFIIGLRIYKWY